MPRKPGIEGGLAIEVELRAEKASAIRRIAQKLESLLAELKRLQVEAGSVAGPARAQREAAFEATRLHAEKQLWYLVVQREAIGLRNHEDVYQLYSIPKRL